MNASNRNLIIVLALLFGLALGGRAHAAGDGPSLQSTKISLKRCGQTGVLTIPVVNNDQTMAAASCTAANVPYACCTAASTGATCPGNASPLVAPGFGQVAWTVITGNGNRVEYEFTLDGDALCTYGSAAGGAPATAPSATAGMLRKANVPYIEQDWVSQRMDCYCLTGTCKAYTTECDP